jgi:hypothetical protein
MANNAITRAILKRRPQAAALATPQAPDPISDQDKQVEDRVTGILSPYEQQQKSALNQRISQSREELYEQELRRGQREGDILKRRFAALGGQAGEETEQRAFKLAGREAGRRLDIGERDIEQQKLAQQQALDELMAERRLGVGERLRGQQFATGERIEGQQFATGERVKGQEFATGERVKGQEFMAEQNEIARNAASELARLDREMKAEIAKADRASASKIAQLNRDMQKTEGILNRAQAASEAQKTRDLESKLADMDRELKNRQIAIAQKELDLNTKISLENIRTRDGYVSDDVLQRLKDAGLDINWFVSGEKGQAPAPAPAPAPAQNISNISPLEKQIQDINKNPLSPDYIKTLKPFRRPSNVPPGVTIF